MEKEGKKGRKSENISRKGGNLFFYEEKLTGIMGLSIMKIEFIHIL